MDVLRINGIASGMDTEGIIRDLMRIEQLKADRLYQERQLLEWEKEDFRSVINKVRAFRDTYFDLLNPQTNLMSPQTLQKRQVNLSVAGLVNVTANMDAALGEINFKVIQSATAAAAVSKGGVTVIRSRESLTSLHIPENNNVLQVTLNGKTKEITVSPGDYESLEALQGELQDELTAAFGEGRITVNKDDDAGTLSIVTEYDSDLLTIVSKYPPREDGILAVLGIPNGASNRLLLNETMANINAKLKHGPLVFAESGESGEKDSLTFKINDVEITINKGHTLDAVLAQINNSAAGVEAAYNTFSDTLILTAKETGGGALRVDDNGSNFFKAFGLDVNDDGGSVGTAGREAVFEINGIRGSRYSNSFTVDGITYNILETGEEAFHQEVKISVGLDIDSIAGTIEKFVADYNELLAEINGKLHEEVFRGFPPLTAEQKENMKEKEIELWEQKARSGLLRRESSLENMLREMRTAMYTAVEGAHIFEFGLETSNDYRDQGKLIIKDGGAKLREALAAEPDKVAAFFTKRAGIDYSPDLSAAQREARFKEAGLAHRLNDILNDNIRTFRDSGGKKGILLERAGMEGDVSEFNNYFDRQIGKVNERIDWINEVLQRKEARYYRQFTAMEKALQQLYTQSDWLMAQLGQFQTL